jgi:glycosyltransferase involved in cell wall biosynthesis
MPARAEVESLMAPLGPRVRFAGAMPHEALPALYADADLYLWPAIDEAFGMAFLEAWRPVCPWSPAVPAACPRSWLTASPVSCPIGDAQAFARRRPAARCAGRARTAGGSGQSADRAHHDERAAAYAGCSAPDLR